MTTAKYLLLMLVLLCVMNTVVRAATPPAHKQDPHVPKQMMPFPWSLQRAAAYATQYHEKNKGEEGNTKVDAPGVGGRQ